MHTAFGVQHLPDPPDTVNHGVVQVEGRVTRGSVDITTRVSTHGVVTATVDTDVTSAGDTLHLHLEVKDVLGLEDVVKDTRCISESSVD